MKRKAFLLIGAAVAFATVATAGEVAPGDVVFEDGAVAQPLTDVAGNAENGRAVMINRKQGNCLACHVVSDMADVPFHGRVGPTLDGVADRYEPAHLRGLLVDAKHTFEGTIMPSFYVKDGFPNIMAKFQGKTILSAQQVEDVLAYLLTLKE